MAEGLKPPVRPRAPEPESDDPDRRSGVNVYLIDRASADADADTLDRASEVYQQLADACH